MMATSTLYEEVVAVTAVYLGPAADRFVTRQVYNHLKKSPKELLKKDLAELIDWMSLAMTLLTEDKKVAGEYIKALKRLSR